MVSFTVARRHDGLAGQYARSMEQFDCGTAMFQPVAGGDMTPPCVGYHDSKGDWNPVANIAWRDADGKVCNAKNGDGKAETQVIQDDGCEPLERPPVKMEQVDIEWTPRTSQGVRQMNLDAQGETPANIPVGANAHVKYKSSSKFGAVLICAKPITQTAYNDETLLRSWVDKNKKVLSKRHGPQLRRYGLILVTTTYRAPRASINAWMDWDKEALVSAKAKAQMLGDDGITLDVNDQLTDKDWTNYAEGPKQDGVVVFFDGFQYAPWDWWWEGVKLSLGNGGSVKEKKEKERQGGSLMVQQATMNAQRPLMAGMSPRESMVSQSRRLWNEQTVQKNGSLEAQSPPRSRRVSPVNGQSQLGVQKAGSPPLGGWQHSVSMPVSMSPGHSDALLNDDRQHLLATTTPNTIDNRLSYGSTATRSSIIRSQDGETAQSSATAQSGLDLPETKAYARTRIVSPDNRTRNLDRSEYPITKVRSARQQMQELDLPRMPFQETVTSAVATTACLDYQDRYSDSSERRLVKSKVQPNGYEVDYEEGSTRDLGASQLGPSSVTPRHSLRHKASSPSLRKSS